jgi:hypothetical protein
MATSETKRPAPAAHQRSQQRADDGTALGDDSSGNGTPAVDRRRIIVHQVPAFLAMIFIAAMYTLIARDSGLGPGVLIPVLVVTLILLRVMATWRGHHRLERKLAIVLLGAITVAEAVVTVLIVRDIVDTSTRLADVTPHEGLFYLRNALIVWLMNILSFSIWYWELDGYGPTNRHLSGYQLTDLLFPQFTISPGSLPGPPWMPHYVDYLFVAFTTSTTFGPADTSVLSARAKVLTMVQTLISMAVLTVVVAWGLSVL